LYNQRETLRIAADLDSARSAGATSFGKLGTCNAAHASDTQALNGCLAEQAKARDEHKQQLDEVMRSGSTSQAEHAREAARFNSRLKTCEDNATTAKRVCDEETARILLDTARDTSALSAQRDEARTLADTEKAQLATLTTEREQCHAERASCIEERDTLKTAAAAAAAAAKVAPVATSALHAPAPGTSGAPAAPIEPIATEPAALPGPKVAPASPAPPAPPPPAPAPAEPKGP
jgi:chromosome condensin MukBEF ATPase and DNA-binding subunit MukB